MRNYDFTLILVSLFVFRVIAFSASFADAACLIGLLAYKLGKSHLDIKKLEKDAVSRFEKSEALNLERFQQLAEEIVKVKNASEGLKAAINLTTKR